MHYFPTGTSQATRRAGLVSELHSTLWEAPTYDYLESMYNENVDGLDKGLICYFLFGSRVLQRNGMPTPKQRWTKACFISACSHIQFYKLQMYYCMGKLLLLQLRKRTSCSSCLSPSQDDRSSGWRRSRTAY